MSNVSSIVALPAAVVLVAFAFVVSARADIGVSDAASESEESGTLSQVVVSARRRTENAQDVPAPIAAASGAALDEAGLYRLEDLNTQFPSTNVEFANPRQSSIAVRGLGNNPANDALESSVGVYLDNVNLGRASMANQDLIDIDQVALLRGPQGTLFGKNTTAGVLNITTRAPTFIPGGEAEASGGNYGYYQVRAALNGPLLDNTLAGRISASRTFREGYVNDIFDGRELESTHRYSVRSQLLWLPEQNLSVRLIADHEEEHSDNGASVVYGVGPNGGAKFLNAVHAAGGVAALDPDYLETTMDAVQHMDVRQSGTSAEANWQFSNYKLTSITAWRSWAFLPSNDEDFINVDAIRDNGQAVNDQQISEEVRLASPGDEPLAYVVGLYYFWQQQHNLQFTQYGADAAAIAALEDGPPTFANDYYQVPQYLRTSSGAVFGQLTWRPIETWEFAAGVRDTEEGKAMHLERSNNNISPAFAASFAPYDSGDLTLSNNSVSGLLSASYKVIPDFLTYASLARGAKAGGINPAVPNGKLGIDSLFVKPETAIDVEFGIKSSWLERRLTVNANVFWTQVKDYQATLLEPVGTTNTFAQELTNVGKVRTRGVETEIAAQPIDLLTLRLSASYDNASYLSYNGAPCSAEKLAPTNAAQGSIICSLTGRPLVAAPTWIVNPGIVWSHPAFDGLTGRAEAGYSWRSKQYGSADDSDYAQIASYGLLDIRYGLQGYLEHGESWTATLWSNNVLDKNYVTGSVAVSSSSYYYTLYPGLPRTYGGTFRITF
jgi:iron complex outermembrane recepter protein